MKRIFSILIAAGIVMSCNNKQGDKEDKAKADSIAKVKEVKRQAEEAKEKIAQELEKLTPLTEEQIKTLMPETMMGANQSNYSFSDNLGAPVANADYKISDSSSVVLTISDCAGPGGAGLYNLQFAGQLDYNTDNNIEYTKVIDFNGGKAIEFCKKTSANCSLTYFAGNRYLVMLEGNNVGADQLKQLTKNMKIK